MNTKFRIQYILLTLMCLGGLSSCYYDNETELLQYSGLVACDTAQTSYASHVVAILESHCLICHSQDNALGGNIFLADYSQVKTKVDDGSFYGSIIHGASYSPMPTAGQKIPECDITRIKSWIDLGAPNN